MRKPIKRTRIKRLSQKDVPRLKRNLRELLHKEIKKRDGNTCFSCGAKNLSGFSWHAGHMFAAGSHPNLKFHPYGIHSQDYNCNINQGGNGASYAAEFIKRYGKEAFDLMKDASRLEKKWRADELGLLIEKIKLGIDHYTGFYETTHGPDLSAAIKKYTMSLAH